MKQKIEDRLISNLNILDIIKEYCLTYPDIRFHQALINLEIIPDTPNKWGKESYDSLMELLSNSRVNDILNTKFYNLVNKL